MPGKRTIPIRGIKKDWYGANEQKILDIYKKYAKMSINNNLLGSPDSDFEKFKSFLVKYEKKRRPKHRQGQDISKRSPKK